MKNFNKWFLVFLVAFTLASCGGGSENGSSSGTGNVSNESNSGSGSSGDVTLPTNVSDYKAKIQAGEFRNAQAYRDDIYGGSYTISKVNIGHYEYQCWSEEDDFLGIDYVRNKCGSYSQRTVSETVDGALTGHKFGDRQAVINKIVSLIDSGDYSQIDYNGRLQIQDRDFAAIIDLNLPLAANPIFYVEKTSDDRQSTSQAVQYSFN